MTSSASSEKPDRISSREMKRSDVCVVRSNMPRGDFEQFKVADWLDDCHYVGESSLAQTNRMVHAEAGVNNSGPTIVKMQKLFPYLRN